MYISDEYLQLEKYIMMRKGSQERRGGILLYIHQDIKAEEIGYNVAEAVWCKIRVKQETHLAGCLYRKGS
jgi:hypothetical protein